MKNLIRLYISRFYSFKILVICVFLRPKRNFLYYLIILLMCGTISFGEEEMSKKIPIIFSKHYDITLLGLQKLHPFDSEKYGRVYHYLVGKVGIDKNKFYHPEIASQEDLLSVHTKEYLSSLNHSINIASIAELGLISLVPNVILQSRILKPMKYATGGTILGCQLAMECGWAINLSGGYHHAKSESGGGFCFFADIPIAVYRLLKNKPELSIMIIDLDAHQGNGYASIFKDDPRIHIFDVYNEEIYPLDLEARRYIEFDFPVKSYIKDKEYLSLLEREIVKAMEESKPGLVIYNAGTDVLRGDSLGCMSISEDGIVKRDEIVFSNAFKKKVPIVMLLSGGYTRRSAAIIGKSIENILSRFQMIVK